MIIIIDTSFKNKSISNLLILRGDELHTSDATQFTDKKLYGTEGSGIQVCSSAHPYNNKSEKLATLVRLSLYILITHQYYF